MHFIPTQYYQNIFEIPLEALHRLGVKHLLADLDNTLDSYRLYEPSPRVVEWKKKLEEQGITLHIISNNHGKRVKAYANCLGVSYLSDTHKPFKGRLLKYLKEHGIAKEEALLVGDQLMTDVWMALRAGLRVVLTEPIVKEDQWTTHFNRLIDRPIRKSLKKKRKIYPNMGGW